MWVRGWCCYGCAFSRRQVEWEAASSLIEGICLTLQRQPIISFLPHLRSLINVCVNLVRRRTRDATDPPDSMLFFECLFVCRQVMGVVGPSSVADGLPLLHLSPYLSPPLPFSTAVVRLVALQIQVCLSSPHPHPPFASNTRCASSNFCFLHSQALKEDFPLSHVISPFTNQERREGMLLNLLIPFVLTVGSGSKGVKAIVFLTA